MMDEIDLIGRPVLDDYVGLLRAMSQIEEPVEIQRLFMQSARRLDKDIGYISLSKRGLPAGQFKITRTVLEQDAEQSTYNPWLNWSHIPMASGGFLGELIAEPRPRLIHRLRVPDDPVLGTGLAGYGSLIASPLFDEGKDLNWSIMVHKDDEGISPEYAEEFFMQTNLVGRMTKGLIDKRRVEQLLEERQRQLLDIANIQRNLLPERLPHMPGLAIATSYLPCNESGGDYYDFFKFNDGRLGIVIADVSGHGAGAATVMAMLQTILHEAYTCDHNADPGGLLAYANEAMFRRRIDGGFVTAFFGVLSEDQKTLVYANAGHNRPILRRVGSDGTGRVATIEGGLSFPLGVVSDMPVEHAEIKLQPGDSVVMYTDGITEARSQPPKREMFGESRLNAAIEGCSGAPDCVIDSIHRDLYNHTLVRDREDDQTIVAMRLERV